METSHQNRHLLIVIRAGEESLFMQTDTKATTSTIILDRELPLYPALMKI
jgi:hypothetical protein